MADASTETLLSVRDLRIDYRTALGVAQAVRGVSFDLHRGEAVGVVGESGCGKTATILGALRLLPEPPARISGGQVRFDGRDLDEAGARERRRLLGSNVGVVFQDPLTSLNPLMRIGAQVSEGPRYHFKQTKAEARENALGMLQQVRIPDPERRADEYPHQLSGGMRQRAMIATALAAGPSLLVADEPTTALDVTVQAQILNLVRRFRRDHGTSLLWISHDIAVVAGMVDRIIVMYAGKIVEEGAVKQILGSPAHPYTKALLASVPRVGSARQRLASIAGAPPDLLNPPPGCPFYARCPVRVDRCLTQPPDLYPVGDRHRAACLLLEPAAAGD
jgi:oligopeptide transport system ATP-binding protein